MTNQTLITGATGFIGSSLCKKLAPPNYQLHKVCHKKNKNAVSIDITPNTDWSALLNNIDTIVHLAARVHVMRETEKDPLAEFRKINTAGTIQLAKAALKAGVKQFIFMSTIKVNGEVSSLDEQQRPIPFTSTMPANPQDPYAVSKYEAEQALLALTKDTDMQLVILRPPLVYGADVKGNFLKLLQLVNKKMLLPFGRIDNQRSLLFVENLTALIKHIIDNPMPGQHVYLVSDDDLVSTKELIQRLAILLNKPARLLPIPTQYLTTLLKLLGKTSLKQRLLDSLVIKEDKLHSQLNWQPPYSLQDGLQQTVTYYLQSKMGDSGC